MQKGASSRPYAGAGTPFDRLCRGLEGPEFALQWHQTKVKSLKLLAAVASETSSGKSRVKQEVVFRIATAHIPELIGQLEPLVPPPPAET